MPEINVTTGSRLPGADEPHAPAISFGEGATPTMLDILRGMDGWNVQITDEHGSYDAVMQSNPVILNEYDIWSLHVERTETDDTGQITVTGKVEVVPLDQIRRIHVW